MFAHTLEEHATRGGLSGGGTLSPMRRRSKGREEGPAAIRTGKPASGDKGKAGMFQGRNSHSPLTDVDKASKSQVGLGHFASQPQYLKLYEVLKAAHSNYKVGSFGLATKTRHGVTTVVVE